MDIGIMQQATKHENLNIRVTKMNFYEEFEFSDRISVRNARGSKPSKNH